MDVAAKFKARVFKQFRNSPHIVALFEILADPLQDLSDVADYILAHLSIDTAEEHVLDMLGEIIGVERPAAQEPDIFTLRRFGEVCDLDNFTGFKNTADATVETGGYMGTHSGLALVSDPDAKMSDEDFRFLLRQKAASFRTKFTRENAFLYLLAFGSRCNIDDDEVLHVIFDPIGDYHDLNSWEKWYVIEKGMSPGGVATRFSGNLRHGNSV